MKMLFSVLGASLMAVGVLSAAPAMTKNSCQCQNCTCTQEKHCGCFSKSGCKCASQSCKCGEKCQCGDNCSCGTNCNCK